MNDVLTAPEGRKTRKSALIGRVSFVVAIMFLAVYLIVILTGSGEFYTMSAERSALNRFDSDIDAAEALAEVHFDRLYEIADKLQYSESHAEVDAVMASYIGDPRFGDLRYYSGDKAYSANGAEITAEVSAHDMIFALSKSKERGATEVYTDTVTGYECIALFVPVRGSTAVDGVLSIIPARNILDISGILPETASASLLIDKSGNVLSTALADGFDETVGNDFYVFLNKLTNDKQEVQLVGDSVRELKKAVTTIHSHKGEYTVAISPLKTFSDNISIVTVSESQGLISPELVYIRHIINLIVIAVISLLIGMIYAIFYYRETQKALVKANYTDATTGLPNLEQFKAATSKLLQQRQQRFAVMVLELRQFRYMSENMDEGVITEVVQFVAKVIETFLGIHETYGYLGDGKYAMTIQYTDDQSVRDKVRLVEAVTGKQPILAASKTKRKFNVGVSLALEMRRGSVNEHLQNANIACENAKSNVNNPFVIFNSKDNAERLRDDRIESEMEQALENREFRLFLQPKYNVAADRIDSAEALVRWFDPKTGDYRFPGEFISLFESNGFITKLDHFMYIETLKTISVAAERGEKIVPISVNVSLVTANAKDFLDFYIDNKKKYKIGDNFITIEFTESIAVGDSDRIYDIVKKLHENGIRVSLDDFGSGYSSFNVLKNIPVDELKLDRLFLASGYDKDYDEKLLANVISLAKAMGVRVVQEGVETKQMFDAVVSMGCDVVQGYYYAKAIPAEEYKLFINSNTSIKYKSLVK